VALPQPLRRMMARLRSEPLAALSEPLDQDFLDECADLDDGCDRTSRYHIFQQYYDGEQGTRLTDRARLYLQRSGLPFSENFCEPIVDVMAERLQVTGFAAEDKTQAAAAGGADGGDPADVQEQDDIADYLDQVWERNRLDDRQGTVHTVALVKGDAFLIVDWDDVRGLPRFTYNRPEIMKPVYSDDAPDTLAYVVKRWNSTASGPQNESGRPIVRMNLFYPDRVEKYFRLHSDDDKGGWQRWLDIGELVWPTPWVDGAGEPLGVTAFHFRHKPIGGCYGRSELRGAIPQQDQLNKQLIDLHDILDYQAWPQRWIMGMTGDNVNLTPNPGEYLTIPGENASAGQFDAADPSGVLKAIESTISRTARRSRTPLHLLVGGDQPSGEALKSAEAGLVAKVEKAQTGFGCVWEDAAMLALRLAVMNGKVDGSVAFDELVLQTQWTDPESRNELAESQALVLQVDDLGLSRRTALRKLGYDPQQEEENRAAEDATMGEAAGRLLDGGGAASFAGTAAQQSAGGTMTGQMGTAAA
jgi:hypothetical protein